MNDKILVCQQIQKKCDNMAVIRLLEEQEKEIERLKTDFKEFLEWGFAKRCSDKDDDCFNCQVWRRFDKIIKS